jgi:hypothetical protein
MKHTYSTRLLVFLCLLLGNTAANAQTPTTQAKLEYMFKESHEKIFEMAVAEKKPVLIYVNANTCFSSRKFSREVMNHEKVKSLLRKKFICMNADVSTKWGKAMASKHDLLMTPAIILYSPGKEILFTCTLKCDTFEMMSQFRSFLSACNLVEQVNLQLATNPSISQKDALRGIAKAYAAKDYKRDDAGNVAERIQIRTLGISFFSAFADAYNEEWADLQSGKGKKETLHYSSNKK